jgi:hypothetical protein
MKTKLDFKLDFRWKDWNIGQRLLQTKHYYKIVFLALPKIYNSLGIVLNLIKSKDKNFPENLSQ